VFLAEVFDLFAFDELDATVALGEVTTVLGHSRCGHQDSGRCVLPLTGQYPRTFLIRSFVPDVWPVRQSPASTGSIWPWTIAQRRPAAGTATVGLSLMPSSAPHPNSLPMSHGRADPPGTFRNAARLRCLARF
jgi:hypothetical protein